MNSVNNWLLHQNPWTSYRVHSDLLGTPETDSVVIDLKKQVVQHPHIANLLNQLKSWPGPIMKRHNDAKLLYHKLVFLADIGLDNTTKELATITDKIIENPSIDGPFQIVGNIPTAFGGTGRDELMWMLCDAPLLTYAIAKIGTNNNTALNKAIQYQLNLLQEFGWPCAATSELGSKFKGPGRRTHPCPYANLIMLKLLSALPEYRESNEAQVGSEMLLEMWSKRKETKYFLFAMGTDFCKLKAPFVWFDILYVLDVLSNFQFIKDDKRLIDMFKTVIVKNNENGLYTSESVYRSWKDWDFGQKKEPSAWITFLVNRVKNRLQLN